MCSHGTDDLKVCACGFVCSAAFAYLLPHPWGKKKINAYHFLWGFHFMNNVHNSYYALTWCPVTTHASCIYTNYIHKLSSKFEWCVSKHQSKRQSMAKHPCPNTATFTHRKDELPQAEPTNALLLTMHILHVPVELNWEAAQLSRPVTQMFQLWLWWSHHRIRATNLNCIGIIYTTLQFMYLIMNSSH